MSRPGTTLAGPAPDRRHRRHDEAAGSAVSDRARLALRRVASGVTVVTVDADGVRHGTTVSAAVTISRQPLVLGLCLSLGSSFGEMVRHSPDFSVNVLSRSQAAVARRFARPDRTPGDLQFDGLRWWADPLTGAPLLADAVAHLSCRTLGRHRVGDHDLLLAEVVDGASGEGEPLVLYAGGLQPEQPEPETATAISEHRQGSI
jgi:flavin reductase (DIM6/NTAB) family NADH-FMN oxidoreductase RutF